MSHQIDELEIGKEIAAAQRDIEFRLSALEHRINRKVSRMELERIDVTTICNESMQSVGVVRIEMMPPVGKV